MNGAEPLRAVDANVLLRYLLNDVPEQAEAARLLLNSDRPIGVTLVALAEVVWTLAGARYRYDRPTVAMLLVDLLARSNLVAIGFEKGYVQTAQPACARRDGAASFDDALIAAAAHSAGVSEAYTFDRRFARAGLIPVPLV